MWKTEQNIAQNEEDEGRGEEKSELLINYDNIDTVEKQNILEKIVELMKRQLAEPPKPKKNWQSEIEREDQTCGWSYRICTDKYYYWRQQARQMWGISYYPIVRDKRNKKTRRKKNHSGKEELSQI